MGGKWCFQVLFKAPVSFLITIAQTQTHKPEAFGKQPPTRLNIAPRLFFFPQWSQEATILSHSWTPTKWIPDAGSWTTGQRQWDISDVQQICCWTITVKVFDSSSWRFLHYQLCLAKLLQILWVWMMTERSPITPRPIVPIFAWKKLLLNYLFVTINRIFYIVYQTSFDMWGKGNNKKGG